MKLLGKTAGTVLFEHLGPVGGRNYWTDGVNATLFAPAIDIVLDAPALTEVQYFYNITPLVHIGKNYGPVTQPKHDALNPVPGNTETAYSPRPATFAEGLRPDPTGWVNVPALTLTSVGAILTSTATGANLPIGDPTTPTWVRLVLTVANPGPQEGYAKFITKWS